MVAGHRRKLSMVGDELPSIVLNNEVIKRVEKIKCLRINVYEILNWEELYITVKNTHKGGMSPLRKLKDILPQRKLEQLYKTLFEIHLHNSDVVWHALSNTKLSQFQRVQTRQGS